MISVTTTSTRRSAAKVLSTVFLSAIAFGFAPAGANAADVVVSGSIDGCVVTISEVGPVDLGTASLEQPEGSSPYYLFEKLDAISVMWETTNVNDCAGALHAEHGGITKTVGETDTTPQATLGIRLSGDINHVTLSQGTSVQVDTSAAGGTGDASYFDVGLEVDPDEGPGDYSATITFTVVVG